MKKVLVFILIFMMVVPVQAFAEIPPEEPPKKDLGINGTFEISVKTDDQWIKAGDLGFSKFQETKEIDLGGYIKGDDVLIKITQDGGGASYLDAVFLDGMQAVKANDSDGKVLNKLSKEDLDVTPVEDGITLEFRVSGGKGILSVTGRIEPEEISKEPLQFPLANNYKQKNQIIDFYSYKLNTNYGRITADGVLDEVAGTEVFAKEYQVPGSGHPAGDTYFWVMNDDENLYVVMDFTPDNTYDGDKDYAKVYVNTDEGIKEFRVSVPETAWGSPGFTYTDKVVYEHKVYEFVIPLSEIGNITDELELAFVGYGTAALPPLVGLPRLAYDPDNGIYLSVYQESVESRTQVRGQFVYKNDDDGTEIMCPDFLIGLDAEFPDVAYDIVNKAFLVVWSGSVSDSIEYTVISIENVDKEDGIIEHDHDIDNVKTLYPISEMGVELTNPAIAYDNNNSVFLIVWENYDYNDDYTTIKGMIFDLDQPDAEAPLLTISIDDYADDITPSVCYSKEHKVFLVVWQSKDEAPMIQANVISSSGTNTTPESFEDLIIIDQTWQYGRFFAISTSINEYNNEFLVTWGDENGIIHGAIVDIDDTDIIYEEEITSYAYHSTSFYDGQGSMLCLWNDLFADESGGRIKMKTFGRDEIYDIRDPELTDRNWGQPVFNLIDSCGDGNGEILVAYGRDREQDISYFIGYRFIGGPEPPALIEEKEPDLAYHPELDIYLSVFSHEDLDSEENSSYIYGQLVNNEGNPIDEKFLINDGTDNEDPGDDGQLQSPSVAVDKDNNFLVAWSQDYSNDTIYACKVEISKSGDKYIVNKESAFRVSDNYDNIFGAYPDIAYDSLNDRFLIIWQQYDSTGGEIDNSWNIFGKIVDINGEIFGDAFPINNVAGSNQKNPSVSYSTEDKKYLVAWQVGDWDEANSVEAVVIDDDGRVYENISIASEAVNPNVSYNKDKFLITWSDKDNKEIHGAYYSISSENEPEINNEKFVISAVSEEAYMSDVFPAAYFDGRAKMLCVWNPGFVYEDYGEFYAGSNDLHASLAYVDSDGTAGEPFKTDEPEFVNGYSPIAITGNMMGQFLIAYETPIDSMYYEDQPYHIGYRLIGEFIPEPEEPGLEFVNAPYEIRVGNTIQAVVHYFDGTEYIDVTDEVFEYSSGNPEIATITSSGAITGVGVGTTTVSAIYETDANGASTTYSAIATVVVTKKSVSRPSPSPQKQIIGQIIVDGKVIKDIYEEDLVSDEGIYSFEAAQTGDNAKLWLLGSYYKKIAANNPNGILQLTWDAASYNLPLKSKEVLKEVNSITGSKVNIVLDKVNDEELIDSAAAALDKLGGQMVSGLVDYRVTVEGKSKEISIDKYNIYVTRTLDNLNNFDGYSTTAMKLIDDEFTFAPSVFNGGSASIKYRGNGIFAIVNNPKSFGDLTNHWSKMNVEKLAARNIAFGKSEGIFAPDDYVTRAEFAVMITRALGITEEEGTMNFEDVKGWYEEDISTAYEAGIINGRSDGKFYPNEKIQRKDMTVMIHNALRFTGKDKALKDKEGVLAMFIDSSEIDEYARECTALCVEVGIIMGRDTKEFDSDEYATRAEASAMIERMLRYLEFIN
jgi:hypothetical protein